MRLTAASRRLVAALASAVMLLAAVSPALAHVFRAAGSAGQPGIEVIVCTTAGLQRVAAPIHHRDAPIAPAASLHDHCPFCFWQACAGAPPPRAPAIAGITSTYAVPAQRPDAPLRRVGWTRSQARAPPAFA
jgi:hypothetical protein